MLGLNCEKIKEKEVNSLPIEEDTNLVKKCNNLKTIKKNNGR